MNSRWSFLRQWAWMLGIFAVFAASPATAHDEHDNLPSSGVAVRGNRLIISPEAEKSLGIATTVIHLQDLEHDVMANATVEVPWRQHAFATSLVAGRIADVLVQPGTAVAAGQVLAQVESQEIETLQADLLKAASELLLAGRLLDQRESLAQGGSISERRVLETQTTRDNWSASRGIVIRKLLSLGFTAAMIDQVLSTGKPIRTVPITSPIRGVISAANVHTGQVVQPWQQVYEIMDSSLVWVHGQVLESDSTLVAEHQPVEVRVDALPEEVFVGVVDHVGVKLDPESRSLHIHVEVPNPQGVLREGMFGRLRIRATVVPEAVACPVDAVVDPGGRPYVLVAERQGEYTRQPVKLGLRSGGYVDVLEGLYPGDPVVTTGKHELASLFSVEDASLAKRAAAKPATSAAAGGAEPRTIIAQAQIELPAGKNATAYSTAPGRISRILVEHGERVHAGQVLAEVESLELRNVQLELLQAQAKLTLSLRLRDRYRKLGEAGAVAQRELWQIETDTENLRTTVESLQNKLALLGLSADEIDQIMRIDIQDIAATEAIRQTLEVRAPIDGRITVFDLSLGRVVGPQDELFEIHDTSRVSARGFVHEQDSAEVRIGQAVKVTITADPAFAATGTIDRKAPTLSTWGRAMSVWVDLDNSRQELKDGMLARLEITVPPAPLLEQAVQSPQSSDLPRP